MAYSKHGNPKGETRYQPGPDPFSVWETKAVRILRSHTRLACLALLRKGYLAADYRWYFPNGKEICGLVRVINPGSTLRILNALKLVTRTSILPDCRYKTNYSLNPAGKRAFDDLPDEVKIEARAVARASLWQIILANRATRNWQKKVATDFRLGRKSRKKKVKA